MRKLFLAICFVALGASQAFATNPATATITGRLYNVDGTTCDNCTITFSPSSTPQLIPQSVPPTPQSVNIRPISTTTDGTGSMTPVVLFQGAAMQVTIQDLQGNSSAPVAVSVAYTTAETLAQLLGGVQVTTGTVGGDLCGTLPNPEVCSFHLTSDADAQGHKILNVGGITGGGSIGDGFSINGVINVKDPAYGAKCDVNSIGSVDTTASNGTITSVEAPWTSADCQSGAGCTGPADKVIRVFGVGGAENLYTTVSTTANSTTVAHLNGSSGNPGLPDYAFTSTGVVDFVLAGVVTRLTDCTWTAGGTTVTCPDAVFPTAASTGNLAMSDGGNWPIVLENAKGSNLTTTINKFNSASSIGIAASPSLSKTNYVAAWGTDDAAAINNALFTTTGTLTATGVGPAKIVFPAGACMIGSTLKAYETVDIGGAGGAGAPYAANNDTVFSPYSGLIWVGKSPPTVALTSCTNPIPGVFSCTTSSAHGLEIGQTVEISGVTPSTYNTPSNVSLLPGGYTVQTAPTATTFTVFVPAGVTGLSSGSGGTIQPRLPMVEFSAFTTPYTYPQNQSNAPGPSYISSIHDIMLIGNSSDRPSAAILWNGFPANRFIDVHNVMIGSNPVAFSIPPISFDPDPVGQFTDGVAYVGNDNSPASIVNSTIQSYARAGVNRSTNVSFTVFHMQSSQLNDHFMYGAGGMMVNSNENSLDSDAFINLNGAPVFTVDDGGEIQCNSCTVENNGQILNFIANSSLGHTFSATSGDYELCSGANPWIGQEVNFSITGPWSIQFNGGSRFSSCASGALVYTGPAFTWNTASGSGTHGQIILSGVQSSLSHQLLSSSFNIVPTSAQSADTLFTLSGLTGNAANIQVGPVTNWLSAPTATVDFTRTDIPPSITNGTAGNWNISQSAPAVAGDVLAMDNTVGQHTLATLPSLINTDKGIATCAAYYHLNEASGNISDSCNSNTGVKSGAGVATYHAASLTRDDTDFAITQPGGAIGPLWTVASDASLPSGSTFSTCFSVKKAVQGTLMQVMNQKTSGFHIEISVANVVSLWKSPSDVAPIAATTGTVADTNAHRICIVRQGSTCNGSTNTASCSANIYIDNVNTTTPGSDYNAQLAPADATLYLGASPTATQVFNGTLDEIYVTKSAITQAQVQLDYIEWVKKKYGTWAYATDGTIGTAGMALSGSGTGAWAAYGFAGWVGTGF